MCVWPERLSGRANSCRTARDPPKRASAEQHHAATPNLRGCVRATHQGAKGVAEGFDEVLVRVGPSSVTLKSDLEITLKTTTAAAAIFEAITRDLAHGWKGGVRECCRGSLLGVRSEARRGF